MLQRVMPRADGHEEHRRAQRRGAPLLPREADSRRTTKTLKGDEKKEAKKNNEAARLWISGIEAVKRKLGVSRASTTSRRRRSSCAARATPRARCSRGR